MVEMVEMVEMMMMVMMATTLPLSFPSGDLESSKEELRDRFARLHVEIALAHSAYWNDAASDKSIVTSQVTCYILFAACLLTRKRRKC